MPSRPCLLTKPVVILALLVSAAGGCRTVQERAEVAPAPELPKLKEEMRLPWAPPGARYMRDWLVCGVFPNPLRPGTDQPPGRGHDVDYLGGMGGEAAARPVAGQTVQKPDGSPATWTSYISDSDIVDLTTAFREQQVTNVVAYAFAIVERPEAGKGALSLGSDDSVKVYLNGELVHDHRIGRAVSKDEDFVPVQFRKGENALLLKVENCAGGWGLVVRVLDEKQLLAVEAGQIQPRIEASPEGQPNLLVVSTAAGGPDVAAEAPPVRVEAVAPGGRVIADAQVTQGAKATFETAAWPDGPYEVHLTQRVPEGYEVFRHLPWYKGDWRAHVRELLDECDALPERPSDPGELRLGVLRDFVLDRLGGDPRKDGGLAAELAPDGWQGVHSFLMEHREVQLGEGSAIRPLGFIRLAWRDPVDDSPQFARAYLPPGYDAQKKWPLVVVLHGYNGPNPPYVRWWGVDGRHHGIAERHGVIAVEPHGRGNTWYEGIGELDVLRAVEEAKAKFSVDDDRVYLMGYSMGGGGTWYVGTRHPDVFAAIGPFYGGWDYHTWLDEGALARLTPRQRFLNEKGSSFAQAEALLTTPVFVNHGDSDSTVDVGFSRYAVRMLQRWGYNIRYWEHPGGGHGPLGAEDELVRWLLTHKLERDPRRVRVRAADLRSAHAHWVSVEQRQDPFAFIHVDARVSDSRTIRLDTENVLQVQLSPGQALVDHSAPVRVIWNGADAGMHGFASGAVTLRAEGYAPAQLGKTPGVAGPTDDLTNTPFAIVVGTASEDPAMRRLCRLQAELECERWRDWQYAEPRFFLDTEIRDEQVRRYSLRLVGGPNENLITRRLAEGLPLQVGADRIVVGNEEFACRNAAVRMAYPHPLNSERYVCVTAATSPGGMYFADDLPGDFDFAITDVRAEDGVPFEDVCIASGSFDHNWQYDDAYVIRGDEATRAARVGAIAPDQLPRWALGHMLGQLWAAEQRKWPELLASRPLAIQELAGRAERCEFTQEAAGDAVLWRDGDGRVEVMFCFVDDAGDLAAVRRVYERTAAERCPLTFAIVRQAGAPEGTYDIFRLSLASRMEHCWRVSAGGPPPTEGKLAPVREDLFGLFAPNFPEPGPAAWAEAFASAPSAIRARLEALGGRHNCAQTTEGDAILWHDGEGRLQAMFFVVRDPADLDAFLRIYERIDESGCPLTYVIVEQIPDGRGNYDVFRLSARSYLEHCNRASLPR